jgi:hypothetical protein
VRLNGRTPPENLVRNKHSWPIFMPGHSLMGNVATLEGSSATCPENPGSIQPAVKCVSRPSLPKELGFQTTCDVVGKRDHFEGRRQDELVGLQDEGVLALGFDQPGQVGLFDGEVDVRVAVVLEDAEVPVQPEVDAGGLDQLRFVRVELDPAGLDLGLDVAIGEEHAGNLPGPV